MVKKPKRLFLYLAIACFAGLVSIFIVDGYMGIHDTIRVTVGEYEREVEADYWADSDDYWPIYADAGDNVYSSYQIGQGNPSRSYLKAFQKAKPGDIICGHDSKDCYPDFGLAQQIARLIPEIKEILANRGISVVTVSEIISPDVSAQD